MKKFGWLIMLAAAVCFVSAGARADDSDGFRLGVGANYWQALDNLDENDLKSEGFDR